MCLKGDGGGALGKAVGNPIPSQVDVERVKDSMGKTGRSALVLIAGSLAASDHYSAKLTEYVLTAPAMVSKGPEVLQSIQDLEWMKMEPPSVKWLTALIKKVPSLQQGLREGSCKRLLELSKSKMMELWLYLRTQKMEAPLLKECSQLLAEATLLWPLDGALQQDWFQCGEMITKATGEVLLQEVAKSCMAVAEVDLANISVAAFGDLAESLDETLSRMGEGASGMPDEEHKQMVLAHESMLGLAGAANLMDVKTQQVVTKCCAISTKISKILQLPALMSEVSFVEGAVKLAECVQQATSAAATGESASTMLSATTALRRQLMVMQGLLKESTSQKQRCRTSVEKLVKEGEAKLGANTMSLLKQSKEKVQQALEVLSPIAQGGDDGSSWLHDIGDDAGFDKIMERYESTMAVMTDKKRLVNSMAELQQVLGQTGQYKHRHTKCWPLSRPKASSGGWFSVYPGAQESGRR